LLPIGEIRAGVQIRTTQEARLRRDFLATNYKADYLERFIGDGSQYGVSLTVSRERSRSERRGRSLLQDKLTEPFVVMNGISQSH
jgi:NDP-sugar pyrophosphorylase family protein